MENKANAILALAYKIIALEALNGQHDGLTVNIGRIEGGIGPNSVPEQANADVDVRFSDAAGANFFKERLSTIMAHIDIPGTLVEAEIIDSCPPMEQTPENRELFSIVQEQAAELNLPVQEEFRAGASDANTVSLQGIPVLDGLGPIGSLDHSDREYMFKDSLVQRSQLFALSLVNAWQRYQSGTLFL